MDSGTRNGHMNILDKVLTKKNALRHAHTGGQEFAAASAISGRDGHAKAIAFRAAKMAEAERRPAVVGSHVPTQSKAKLARDFRWLGKEAGRADLFDLVGDLEALSAACSGDDRESKESLVGLYQAMGGKDPSEAAMLSTFSQHAHGVKEALCATRDKDLAAEYASGDAKTRDTILTGLAGRSNFDRHHAMGGLLKGGGWNTMMRYIHPERSEQERQRLAEFEAADPMTNLHRRREQGYSKSRVAACRMTTWMQANELGRDAWERQNFYGRDGMVPCP